MPLPILPAALLTLAAPPAVPLAEAELTVLEYWDRTGTLKACPMPIVSRKDQPTLAWLASSLEGIPHTNPFPKGHPGHAEAAAILALQPGAPAPTALPRLTGSHFALWHWLREQARKGNLPTRQAWEDLLVKTASHPLVREAVLRHALSFALGAADETRLAALKAEYGAEAPEAFRPFLNAQGVLGGPIPLIRVWSLPDLAPRLLADSLGHARRIWIAPAPEGVLPPMPPDVLWLIPTVHGLTPANEELLDDASRTEGEALAARLKATGLNAALAPSRASLEKAGLVHFPALIEVDAQGNLRRILMAEACLAEGHSLITGPKPR